MTSQQKRQLKQYIQNGDIQRAVALLNTIDTRPTRTIPQNNSLHLYLTLVADELDKRGFTMQDVVKAIRRAEIRPTMDAMKAVVWKPLQLIITGKESTTQIKTGDVDRVYETMNKWLGDNFDGIHVPFPNDEEKQLKNLGGYKTASGQGTEGVDYPELTDLPRL